MYICLKDILQEKEIILDLTRRFQFSDVHISLSPLNGETQRFTLIIMDEKITFSYPSFFQILLMNHLKIDCSVIWQGNVNEYGQSIIENSVSLTSSIDEIDSFFKKNIINPEAIIFELLDEAYFSQYSVSRNLDQAKDALQFFPQTSRCEF